MCIDHRKTANSNHFACATQKTQHVHRTPNTRSRFLGYYCGFFPLVPIGGVTMIFCDTDMVFY